MAQRDDALGLYRSISRRQLIKAGAGSAMGVSLASLMAASGASASTTKTSTARSASASTGTLTIGISGDPTTLDPEFGQSEQANELIKNLYSQWVKYHAVDSGKGYMQADVSKTPLGLALASYEQVGSTISFESKTGTLPSGTALSAETFIYKVARSLGLDAGSTFDFNVLGVTKNSQVKKLSDTKFEFELPHPTPILGPILRDQDAGLVDPGVIKAHATSKDPWAHAYVAQHAAPTGAYTLVNYTPGSRLTLQANPHYPGPKANIENVILQEIPSAADRALYLKEGQIDIANGLSLDQIVALKGASGVNVISVPSTSQDIFGFVCNKAPFSDVRLRQAIAYAVPYKQIVQSVLKGEALVAKGVWPEKSIWFDKSAPYPYKYDPAQAKALLKEAGMSGGFSFTCQVSSADDDAQALAVPVQSALSNIGIKMNIATTAPATFATNLSAGTPQAWIQSSLDFYVDDPYYRVNLFYWSKGAVNWMKYSDPRIDAYNTQLSKTTDSATKRKIANAVQVITNEAMPALSLGETNFLLPIRDDVGGFLYEPDSLLTYGAFTRKS
jgi:peptide/nickel transport system substrate-binding protein